MQFMYPSFLWALLALAVPIIIHLFYFRRFKKVYFTNVKFLKEVKEETSSRNKLKNLLTLLMRLLALAFLVGAFAQPFIPQGDSVKTGTKGVSIYIDNSFSMNALSQDVPLITKAKDNARAIIEAYTVEDKFQILTNDFEGRHQRLLGKEDAIALIDEIETTPAVKHLDQVSNRQLQTLNSHLVDHKILYFVSDFQKNITDLKTNIDTSLEYNFVPLQSVQERNLSLDSCWFEAPVPMLNQPNQVYVKITNHSDATAENVRLSILENGQNRPLGSFDIDANNSVTESFNLSIIRTGWHKMELQISDYPVQFDDSYLFAFNIEEKIKVLVVNANNPSKYLNAAFEGISYFEVTNQNTSRIDYAGFSEYDLIVLNDLNNYSTGLAAELNQYVEAGGNLLWFPGSSLNVSSANYLCNQLQINNFNEKKSENRIVGSINKEEFIFNNVFQGANQNIKLPTTSVNFNFTNFQRRGEQQLLSYRDGSSFLSKYVKGDGNIYLSAAPINNEMNDLVRNAEIFIPMLYKMSISSGKKKQIAYTIGSDELLEVDANQESEEIVYKLQGREEFIPGQITNGNKKLLDVHDNISEADFYDLKLQQRVLGSYAFNYDRTESNLACFTSSELASSYESWVNIIEPKDQTNLASIVSSKDRGTVLWRWCIILVLIFLGIEALLLRFWQK